MPFVNNFNNQFTPDVFVKEATPAASIRAASIGVVGVVMQANRGPVGVSTLVGSLSQFVRLFGGYDSTLPGEYMFVYNLFANGASNVKVVRVTDGNEDEASVTTPGASGSTFELATPGTWGNSVQLKVAANTATGYVDLTFTNGAEVYSYKQVTFTDSTNSRYISTVLNNSSDGFVTLQTNGLVNPTVGTYTFAGGSNGTSVGDSLADAAYTGSDNGSQKFGLIALEPDDSVELVTVTRATTATITALNAHVSLLTVTPRLGLAAPAKGTTVAQANTLMAAFNNERLAVFYPFQNIGNPATGLNELCNVTSMVAGVLSGLSYEQSPSRKQIVNVVNSEFSLSRADVDSLSQNRINAVTLLAGQGFVIRNGINSSSNPAQSNITRTRAYNFFAKTLEKGSQQFVSRPHTPQLRQDIVSAYGALIGNEVLAGKIGNVNGGKVFAVKCDAQNNPDSVVRANQCMVDVQISLWAPADFIDITLDASEAKTVQ